MLKYEICQHFNKSNIWLSSSSGKKRLQQCEEMTGGVSLSDFQRYQLMQTQYLIKIKQKLTYLQIGKILFKTEQYRQGYKFINNLAYRVYDDDYFLGVDTITKLRKLMGNISH